MYCTNCGNKNDSDSEFCTSCGNKLTNKSKKNKIEDVLFVPEKKSHTFRNIVLTIAVVGVLLILLVVISNSSDSTSNTSTNTPTSSNENINGWQPFSSVEHKFIAYFPTQPSNEPIKPEALGDYKMSGTTYSSEDKDKNAYMIAAYDYTISPKDYDFKGGLERMMNGFIGGVGNSSLTSSDFTNFKNYQALEFNASTKDGIIYKGLIFIRDDLPTIKAFAFIVGGYNEAILKYQDFINSFQLTN